MHIDLQATRKITKLEKQQYYMLSTGPGMD